MIIIINNNNNKPKNYAEDVEKNPRQSNTLLQHVSNWHLPSR